MKRGLTIALYTTLLLVAAAGFVLSRSGQFKILSVQSDSMAPTLRRGDTVIVHKAPFSTLKRGNIVSYRSPQQPKLTITHRVIAKNNQKRLLTTKADASNILDGPMPPTAIVGKVTAIIPRAGYLVNFLCSIPGIVFCVYLSTLCVAAAEGRAYLNSA